MPPSEPQAGRETLNLKDGPCPGMHATAVIEHFSSELGLEETGILSIQRKTISQNLAAEPLAGIQHPHETLIFISSKF